MITFVIPGPPVPWSRAGAVAGKDGSRRIRMFTTKKCTQYKKLVQIQAKLAMKAHGGMKIKEGPVHVDFHFHFEVPKSYCRKNHPVKAAWQHKKPDIDNLMKCILDAVNGICFVDDAQVCSIAARKIRLKQGEDARTFVSIVSLGELE